MFMHFASFAAVVLTGLSLWSFTCAAIRRSIVWSILGIGSLVLAAGIRTL